MNELFLPSDEFLTELYGSSGLFARIIDQPAEEALRKSVELAGITSTPRAYLLDELERLGWEETAMNAVRWARLYGGALVVMFADDGGGLEEPLSPDKIRSVDDLKVFGRPGVEPLGCIDGQPDTPEYFRITWRGGTFTVHGSRCLLFRNGILPESGAEAAFQFWGIPEYLRIKKALLEAERAPGMGVQYLQAAVQPVYKMRGLSAELATAEGEGRVLDRLRFLDEVRGLMGTIAIDVGEDFRTRTGAFENVGEASYAAFDWLAAVCRIPQRILFGNYRNPDKPQDETSLEVYYNFVEQIQHDMIKGNLHRLLSVIVQAGLSSGELKEAPPFKIVFPSLWNEDARKAVTGRKKEAEAQLERAKTAARYVRMGALFPQEVRRSLANTEKPDPETMLDE